MEEVIAESVTILKHQRAAYQNASWAPNKKRACCLGCGYGFVVFMALANVCVLIGFWYFASMSWYWILGQCLAYIVQTLMFLNTATTCHKNVITDNVTLPYHGRNIHLIAHPEEQKRLDCLFGLIRRLYPLTSLTHVHFPGQEPLPSLQSFPDMSRSFPNENDIEPLLRQAAESIMFPEETTNEQKGNLIMATVMIEYLKQG